MGICQSKNAAHLADKTIDAELKKEVRSDLSRIRLLLLGLCILWNQIWHFLRPWAIRKKHYFQTGQDSSPRWVFGGWEINWIHPNHSPKYSLQHFDIARKLWSHKAEYHSVWWTQGGIFILICYSQLWIRKSNDQLLSCTRSLRLLFAIQSSHSASKVSG